MPDLKIRDEVIRRAMAAMPLPAALRLDLPKRVHGTELDPALLAVLGAIADGASTANFMRRGTAEDNALFHGLARHPAVTGMAVAGSLLPNLVATMTMGKKFPGLTKALLANEGAARIGIASENLSQPTGRNESGVDAYHQAIVRALTQRSGGQTDGNR